MVFFWLVGFVLSWTHMADQGNAAAVTGSTDDDGSSSDTSSTSSLSSGSDTSDGEDKTESRSSTSTTTTSRSTSSRFRQLRTEATRVTESAVPGRLRLVGVINAALGAYFIPNICATTTTLLVHAAQHSSTAVGCLLSLAVSAGFWAPYCYACNRVVWVVPGVAELLMLTDQQLAGQEFDLHEAKQLAVGLELHRKKLRKATVVRRRWRHPAAISAARAHLEPILDSSTQLLNPWVRNYYCIDVMLSSLIAIIGGIRPDDGCANASYAMVGLSLLHVVNLMTQRPLQDTLEYGFAMLTVAINLAIGALVPVSLHLATQRRVGDDEEDWASELIGRLVLAQLITDGELPSRASLAQEEAAAG